MTRIYNTRIEVELSNGVPHRFKWRNKWREIRMVYERSLLQAEWWRQEVNRVRYSVECEGWEQYEIYRQGDRWFLERVWD